MKHCWLSVKIFSFIIYRENGSVSCRTMFSILFCHIPPKIICCPVVHSRRIVIFGMLTYDYQYSWAITSGKCVYKCLSFAICAVLGLEAFFSYDIYCILDGANGRNLVSVIVESS